MKVLISLVVGFAMGYYVHSLEVRKYVDASKYDQYIEWMQDKGHDLKDLSYEEWTKLKTLK